MTLKSIRQALRDVSEDDLKRAGELATDGAQLFFIGNGGSAAIASHMAADWLKTAGRNARSFNDPALMSCLANDLGYEHVFDTPLRQAAMPRDALFAISSSGQSKSILNAAELARRMGMWVITLSGFAVDNSLSAMGDVNFHVASDEYGVVEVAHHAICHAILDQVMHDAG